MSWRPYRKDHPLIAHRLRQAAKRGTRIYVLHSVDDDWLMPIAGKKIVAPSEMLSAVSSFKEVPIGFALGLVAIILLGSVLASLIWPQPPTEHGKAEDKQTG